MVVLPLDQQGDRVLVAAVVGTVQVALAFGRVLKPLALGRVIVALALGRVLVALVSGRVLMAFQGTAGQEDTQGFGKKNSLDSLEEDSPTLLRLTLALALQFNQLAL